MSYSWEPTEEFFQTTNGSLPKPNALQPEKHITYHLRVLCFLQVHSTVVLKVAHYRTGKLMPIRFFIVDTKNEVIISCAASTEQCVLKVLCHSRASLHRYLDAVRKHTSQPLHISNTVTIPPFQDHILKPLFQGPHELFLPYKTIKPSIALKTWGTYIPGLLRQNR